MWRAAQPLKEEKQNLREKGKQVECRQADTPRTGERASDVCSATTTAGEHFRELRMCILLSPLSTSDVSSCYAMQAAIWLSRVMLCGCFEYHFKEVRMMNRMQCYKLWKDVNELCLQTSWPLFERSGSLNWSKMTEKKQKTKKTATLQSLEIKMTASICRTKKEKKCKHYKLLQTLTNHKWN